MNWVLAFLTLESGLKIAGFLLVGCWSLPFKTVRATQDGSLGT